MFSGARHEESWQLLRHWGCQIHNRTGDGSINHRLHTDRNGGDFGESSGPQGSAASACTGHHTKLDGILLRP
jgi:hypothetical protein